MKTYRLLVLCALVMAWLARPAPAWACSCVPAEPPAIAFAQADAVFAGRVTGIVDYFVIPFFDRLVQLWPGAAQRFYDVQVTFSVSDSWKGVATSGVTLHTGHGGGDCGYVFSLGGRYVVYGYHYDGSLSSNSCTRTNSATSATVDMTYLNTLPRLSLTAAPASPVVLVCLGVVAVIALLAIASVWRARRTAAGRSRIGPEPGEP